MQISYIKFAEFSEEIKDHSEDALFIAEKVMEMFYPTDTDYNRVIEFEKAIKQTTKLRKYKLNLKQLHNAGKFIDAENFYRTKDFESLFNLLIKKPYFYKIDVNKIDITNGKNIVNQFLLYTSEIKKPFQFLLNPPMGVSGELTEGSLARQDFARDYGAYMEMAYTILKGDLTKIDLISKMKTDTFLFIGEYLIRKKYCENLK